MADHNNQQKRIHPLADVEAPRSPSPTHPLFPRNTSKSDNPNDDHHRSPSQPIPRRTFPVSHSKPPKRKRSCLCRLLCWTFSLLLILIIAVGITVGVIYLIFRPKMPKFSVDQLQVVQFNLSGSNSLSATFDARITATNPNKRIGIYYEGGSNIEAWYEETNLARGSFPKFYQGHRNTTALTVIMTGQTEDASGLFNRLQQQQQETGNIPLNLKVKQPVRVKLGKLKLFKVKFRVRCRLVVDSLTAQNGIRIQNSSCKFRGIRL
ncbi:NDR1/HIN1-like protein 6 [Neltuma alba]|uniref:NDR1/HIN1-like protein 6 n=1 Tax=Neltuma alba TaxID=207710 RepID=UPI0010A4B16E|nr:NDR1/HIN1-like protein 6 [Prosopis alba]